MMSKPVHSPSVVKRFWNFVERKGRNQCWEWRGSTHIRGYGFLRIAGKNILAHRVSWEISRGRVLGNLCSCHKCDNPSCVNPYHLFSGTQGENMRDMKDKGRVSGERNANARLTHQQVDEIRALRGKKLQKTIAEKFGISRSQVSQIQTGKYWK